MKSPEYRAWSAMRTRCNNPNSKCYALYGGRWIRVCERWDCFANFLTDMGEKPGPLYTLDRIDCNRGYSKVNCRWATPTEQARNQRSNIRVRGKRTWEWASQLNISLKSFHHRLWRFRTGRISEAHLFAKGTPRC